MPMHLPIHILLASDDSIGKVIFGVIAVVIWGVSALGSMMKKQKQEAERRRAREAAMTQSRPVPPPQLRRPPQLPPRVNVPQPTSMTPRQIAEGLAYRHPDVLQRPAPPLPRPVKLPPIPQAAQRARERLTATQPRNVARPKQRAGRDVQREQPILELSEEMSSSRSLGAIPPMQRNVAVQSASNAAVLRRLMNPQMLRSEFLISEILQPPLALREPRE